MGIGKNGTKGLWLLLALAVIAPIVYYAFYSRLTQTRRDYAVNNAFATLTVAADELSERLSVWGVVVKNARAHSGGVPEAFNEYLRVLVPGLQPCVSPSSNGKKAAGGAEIVTRLSFQGNAAADRVLQLRAVDKAAPDSSAFRAEDQAAHDSSAFRAEDKAAPDSSAFCAQTTLEELLRPMLADSREVFENVLLAGEDGEVLYQDARSDSRLMRLDSLIAAAPQRKPPGAPDKTDSGGKAVPVGAPVSGGKFAQSSNYTQVYEVDLAGEDHMFFVQPVPVTYTGGICKNKCDKLLLVGELRQSKLDERTGKVPMNSLSWALLAFLLSFSVAWTVSRLPGRPQLMPMRNIDVIGVTLMALISVAAMAIGVVHVYTQLWFDMGVVDKDLERLAKRLNTNAREELARFAHLLQATTESAALQEALAWRESQPKEREKKESERKKMAGCCILTSILKDASAQKQPVPRKIPPKSDSVKWKSLTPEDISAKAYSFPFFDYVLWSDMEGWQIAKFSIRKDVTPPTPTKSFRWYPDILNGRLFQLTLDSGQQRLLGCPSARLLVEPLYSPNTGEYLTVIGAPFSRAKDRKGSPSIAGACNPMPVSSYKGAGLVLARLASLNSPIFPPGYGFVIIDGTGKVLYSSRPSPPKKNENFLRDTQDNPQVKAHAALKEEASLTVSYRGNPTRLHIAPFEYLENASWTIVTWRDLAEDRQAQVDTLGRTLLLMIPHALIGLLSLWGWLWGWLWLRTSMAATLWPRREFDGKYLMLMLLMTGASLYLVLLTLAASNNAIYFGMLILAPAAVFASVALLLGRARLADVLVSPFLIGAVFNLIHPDGYWRPSDFVLVLIGIMLLVAVWQFEASAERVHRVLSSFEQVVPSLSGRWVYLYTGVIAIGFLALSVIPAVANYRLAYDSTRIGKTMRDLVELSRALEGRERSAQEYYGKIELATESREKQRFAADRLSVTLDRYDLSLTSSEAPRETLTGANPPATGMANLLGFFGVPSAAARAKASSGFSIPNPEVLQFAYSSSSAGMELTTAPGSGARARHVASHLVSLADMSWQLWGFALVLVAIVYKLILSTVRFLFLLGVDCPKALRAVKISDLPAQSQNLILLGLASTGKSKRLRTDNPLGYLDMSNVLRGARGTALPSGPVVIDHFDIGWGDGKSDELRLKLLERLLYEEGRTVVLVCVHDPVQLERERNRRSKTQDAESAEAAIARQRWSRIWLRFPELAIESSEIQEPEGDAGLEWTNRIYASCTQAQRAALYHVITEGWINPKNCKAVGELVRRGLLKMSPAPDIPQSLEWMRKHIRGIASSEDVHYWKTAGGSFSPLSFVVWAMGCGVILLLLVVGRDYIGAWAGFGMPVVTAIGVMWKLYSDVRPRIARVETKESDVNV